MFVHYTLSAFSSFIEKADHYLLPCPFKYLTGHDCPGCGFQRSVLALLRGDFKESLHLYPATVPLLVTVALSLAANRWWKPQSKMLINVSFMITATVILVSYLFKLAGSGIF
ncbi:MAG TPA: DUF2752 domain-containing protein [Pedobacter sp.]